MSNKHSQEQGKYAYEGLDRTLHEKARLGILTCLATHPEGLLFNELKDLCALSDGNLSRHLQVLEKESLVEIWKSFHKRRPQTLCKISPNGLKRFQDYLMELEKVLEDAASVHQEAKDKNASAIETDGEGLVTA